MTLYDHLFINGILYITKKTYNYHHYFSIYIINIPWGLFDGILLLMVDWWYTIVNHMVITMDYFMVY